MDFPKIILILSVLLLICAGGFADVGPSPSYSFSISNTADYPDYSFFYVGNVWQDELMPVAETTPVYKLNTHITVYAVPLVDAVGDIGPGRFESVTANAVKSQEVLLPSGHTTFEIQSFNAANRTMHLQQTSNIPDTGYTVEFFIYGIIFLLLLVLPILIPIIIVAAVVILVILFLLKKSRAGK